MRKNPGVHRHIGLFARGMFFCVFALWLGGCVGSADMSIVKHDMSQANNASSDNSVSTTRENLSMAKKLKEQPRSPYVLGPEDTVEIAVFRHEELKMQCTISPEGKISYFLVGDIAAAGLTQFELRDRIENGLAKYIKNPHVVVRVVEPRSHKVYVLGQVKKPGVYRMTSNFMLVEAISAAGGIDVDAYLSGAYVVRNGEILLVNFYELIQKGNTEENIPLFSGDVVYIPDNREQRIFVLGEVNKQAAIPMRERMTLFEAVAEAGGFTRDAEKASILVMRGNLSEPEVIMINAKNMALKANIPLERGDIVYVASTTFADVERVAMRISNVLKPFLDVARGIIFTKGAVDVLDGDYVDTRIVLP
jgi:polysaccharide biosynthesis/export protein